MSHLTSAAPEPHSSPAQHRGSARAPVSRRVVAQVAAAHTAPARAVAAAVPAALPSPPLTGPVTSAERVQSVARSAPLPVHQPWVLAIGAIAALAAVSAACANVVVRRRRG